MLLSIADIRGLMCHLLAAERNAAYADGCEGARQTNPVCLLVCLHASEQQMLCPGTCVFVKSCAACGSGTPRSITRGGCQHRHSAHMLG